MLTIELIRLYFPEAVFRKNPEGVLFSEDLDFDNFGLSFEGFKSLLDKACPDMEYKGFVVEYRMVEQGAFYCYIRFPEILYKTGISPDRGRKILIQVDTEAKEKIIGRRQLC